jgi:hypothetical protein
VYGGAVTYPPAQARDVFRAYRELTADAPDELTAYVGVQPLATGPAFSIVACWSGDVASGERALAPIRSMGTPVADTLRAMPYLEMQALFAVPPVRVGSYARSSFLRELDDATIEALVARTIAPAPPSLYFLEHLHGRASTIGADEAAFGHRGPGYSFAAVALWFEPGEAAAATAWIRDFFGEMTPFLASGVYTNYLASDEGDARVRAAYGGSWDRLAFSSPATKVMPKQAPLSVTTRASTGYVRFRAGAGRFAPLPVTFTRALPLLLVLALMSFSPSWTGGFCLSLNFTPVSSPGGPVNDQHASAPHCAPPATLSSVTGPSLS